MEYLEIEQIIYISRKLKIIIYCLFRCLKLNNQKAKGFIRHILDIIQKL